MPSESAAPSERRVLGRWPAAEQRRDVTRIVHASLLLLLFGGLGVTAIAFVLGDYKALAGAAAVALVAPGLLLALRRGFARFAMTGAVTVLFVVSTVEVCIGEGVHDVGICLFAVVVMVSALLLDRRSSLLFSVLSVLTVAAIGIAELTGRLTTRLSHAVLPAEVGILVFLLGIFAVLIHAVARALYKGLDDAALNEQTYREIFDATSDAIVIHDVETGRIVDANEAACALWGSSREELRARSPHDLLGGRGEAERRELDALLARVVSGSPQAFEAQVSRGEGSELWLDVALRAATIRGKPRVLVAVRDISERKAAADQLRLADRLQIVGRLAGGVAHDFNNQLAAIMANAGLLRERVVGDAAAAASLQAIVQCCNRSADLTRQLLAFARKGERREHVVDLDELVRELAALLERSIDKRVVLDLDLAGEGRARVLGDASFLQSALLNLGLNARDAMPHGGILGFETRRLPAEALPEAARAQLSEPSSEYVRVRVIDTGVGIAPEALGRIFEPFFTTKARGYGIGLAAAYGTVQAHRGAILVHSTEGVGTTFELFLPATDRPLARPRPEPASARFPQLRVLLAEDEHAVGLATQQLLQELGCTVTWCRDGREAIEAFERNADGFDVVMLDHAMPHALGSEVAERIAQLRPGLPIIATSGFAETADEDAGCARRIFLPKPFDFDQLTAALRQALGVG